MGHPLRSPKARFRENLAGAWGQCSRNIRQQSLPRSEGLVWISHPASMWASGSRPSSAACASGRCIRRSVPAAARLSLAALHIPFLFIIICHFAKWRSLPDINHRPKYSGSEEVSPWHCDHEITISLSHGSIEIYWLWMGRGPRLALLPPLNRLLTCIYSYCV